MIQFKGVHKWFGKLHVLDNIHLDVEAGEVVVICGPSGSGKSTLIRCTAWRNFKRASFMWIVGPYHQFYQTELRVEIGFVFQQFHLYPYMTALINITLAPINVRKMKNKDAEELAREKLSIVGRDDKADAYPAQLSGGQQQRLAIARGAGHVAQN